MQSLIWNIFFSSFFILCIKWTQKNERTDVVTVGAINYIVAAIWGFRAYRESSPSDQVLYAIWSGSALGTCYFVAFFFLIYAVHWVGASNSAAVSRLSLVIPVAAGILLWGEHLNGYQSMGIVVAFVSLFLVGHSSRRTQTSEPKNDQGKSQNEMTALLPTKNAPSDQGPWWLIWFVLLTFFVICGCSRLTQQACNQMCHSAKDYPTFLFAAFVAAGIPSLCVLIFRRNPISRWELVAGVLLGLSNIFQSHYILQSLDAFPGNSAFVFTVTSTGGLVLTTGVAVLLMKERINWQSGIGIALASASIFLLRMSTPN